MPWTYPALVALAVLTGVLVARLQGDRLALTRRQRLALGLGAFVGGMLGAKLPFLLTDAGRLASGAAWLEGGKTLVTGLVGGYFGVEVAKRAVGVTQKTGDALCVPLAAALAVGRLSCFVAGCCHGLPTTLPWGVDFGDGVRRHPTQLYEAAFHASAALALLLLRRRGFFPRNLVKLYVAAYLVYRFLTEYLRPEPRLVLGLTLYQVAALVFLPVFLVLAWRDRPARTPG